ncbi:MAG: oligosaccharide flippase family protein, partial [Alphaproteobacteria bacterium]|nr:oligosaccharide flippase family protein [Alphaproteobacteria bacterium]
MIKKQIVKNFISAWLAKFIKLASSIYLVPLFVQHMGKDAYGLIILLTTILSFAVLADIGIRAGVTRYMTRAISLEDHKEFNKVLNTGIVIYISIWFLLSIALLLGTNGLITLFNVPKVFESDCRLLLRTYGVISLFWSFTTPLFGAVSSATNRYDLSNYRELIIGTLSMVVLVLAIHFFDIGIIGWALITILTQIVTAITMIRVAFYLAPFMKISIRFFDFSKVKELLQFGGITFIGGWSRRMKIDADPLLISSVMGPSFISLYRSGVALSSHSRVLLASFTGQINSVSTNLHARGDHDRLVQLFERGTRLTLLMGVPVLTLFMVFSNEFIDLWLGTTFSSHERLDITRCCQGMALVDFCFY